MKTVINGLAIVVVMLFLSGLFGLFKPASKQPVTEPQPATQQVVQQPAQQETKTPAAVEKEEPGDLVIVSSKWEFDEEQGINANHMDVIGEVKNTSNKVYRYVELYITLLDDSGAQVGTKLTNTVNLHPGQSWKFSVPIYNSKAVKGNVHVTGNI